MLEQYLSTVTVGMIAIALTSFLLALFFVVMGLLALLAIKTGRAVIAFIRRAIREPEVQIVRRFKRLDRRLAQDEQKRRVEA